MTDLTSRIRKLFLFSFADEVISRLSKYLGIFILIHLLTRETVGILGIATGYIALLSYLFISPENILLRDFHRDKRNRKRLMHKISAYINFWVLKSVAVMAVSGLIFLFLSRENLVLGVVFLAIAVQRLLEQFSDLIQLVFYVDFKQKKVTIINFFYSLILLALFIILLVKPSLYTYLAIVVLGELALSSVWYALLKSDYNFSYHYVTLWVKSIKKDIIDFALWHQLGRAVINFLQNIGPAILSFFAGLAAVGDYTIALKIANVFLITPQLLQKSNLVHFSYEMPPASLEEDTSLPFGKKLFLPKTLRYYLAVHGAISCLYLIAFAILGKFFIFYFLTRQNVDSIFRLTLILLAAVGIYHLSRPFLDLASARFSLKESFFKIYLPVFATSIPTFSLMAKYFGVWGLAAGSIASYMLLFILGAIFTLKRTRNL